MIVSYGLDSKAGFFGRVVKVDVDERNLYTLAVATLKDVADIDALWVAVRIVGRRKCAVA